MSGTPVQILPLAGPLAARDAEISGMAWYGDRLVLLPQYPERFGGSLFVLDRSDIVARIDGRSAAPLRPRPIPFHAPDLRLPGYEGFESIAFVGRRAFLTIETQPDEMLTVLVSGEWDADGRVLRLDPAGLTRVAAPAALVNMSHEALVATDDAVLALFEANGRSVNPRPAAELFGFDLARRGTAPFPALEFRVTDATPPDGDGRFWVPNVFYVGDTQLRGASTRSVEQLVELRWRGDRVERTEAAPIVLQRIDDRTTRNWEGIARLEGRGFLLATDTFPETLLGFVPHASPGVRGPRTSPKVTPRTSPALGHDSP